LRAQVRAAAIALAFCLPAAAAPGAAPPLLTLSLPRAPAANEEVWLSVDAGALPRGAGIRVDAPDGSNIELLTSFGGHAGTGGAAFIVPLPQNLIAKDGVRVRLTVVGAGPSHAPTRAEVKGAHLIFVPVRPR
jgi:hypothetical protein